MKRKLCLLIGISIGLLWGCSSEKAMDTEAVTVLLTRDYGREVLAEKIVAPEKGDTVMDVMLRHFDVETAYGGGFVNSIEGLSSGFTGAADGQKRGTKQDWFYYIDGIMAEAGAGQFPVAGVSEIAWDYHGWANSMVVRTRIDAWPERFAGRQVDLAGGASFEKQIADLKTTAEAFGGKAVLAALESMDIEALDRDTVFVGTWEELEKIDFARRFFEERERAGLFAAFTEEGLVLFDDGNMETGKFGSGALVVCFEKSYGSDAMVLLIVGNDVSLIEEAAALFADPEFLKGFFTLAVTKEGIHYAP